MSIEIKWSVERPGVLRALGTAYFVARADGDDFSNDDRLTRLEFDPARPIAVFAGWLKEGALERNAGVRLLRWHFGNVDEAKAVAEAIIRDDVKLGLIGNEEEVRKGHEEVSSGSTIFSTDAASSNTSFFYNTNVVDITITQPSAADRRKEYEEEVKLSALNEFHSAANFYFANGEKSEDYFSMREKAKEFFRIVEEINGV